MPKKQDERTQPMRSDLDPEEVLKALLKVDPHAEPVEDDSAPPHGDPQTPRKAKGSGG